MSNTQQPIKFTLTHYRKPEHTHEAFIKWIVEEHLPLAMPVFKKHGVIKYSLFVTPSSMNDALKQEIGPSQPSWGFADFDCFIEYILPNVETIKRVMMDPSWAVAIKDQDDWVDTSNSLVSLGHCTTYLEENGDIASAAN